MFNVCHHCGLYHADKIIDPAGPFAVCPACGHEHPFKQLPLLMVSGASGAGKSTVCHQLLGTLTQAVLLDSDILWRPEFNKPDEKYRDFFETWLRMAKNISQAGRPVVIFGAGTGVPENIEPCIERRYFSAVKYLALVCDDDHLAARLRARPAWRGSGERAYIEDHLTFNRWFKTQGEMITRLDTTHAMVNETAEQVRDWIKANIP
jgi:predicted kinase